MSFCNYSNLKRYDEVMEIISVVEIMKEKPGTACNFLVPSMLRNEDVIMHGAP